jgi:hypothetical protein
MTTMINTKVGTGSLRAVEPKSEKHPSYKGSIMLNDGKKYWLSGWRRMGDDGKYWLSLSVDAADQQEQTKPAKTYAQRRDYDEGSAF